MHHRRRRAASNCVLVDDRDVGLGARLACTRRRRRTARARATWSTRVELVDAVLPTLVQVDRARVRDREHAARRRRCRSCVPRRASMRRYSTDDPLRSPTSRRRRPVARPVHLPAARREQVGLHELAHGVVEPVAEPALVVGRERQLVRRARDLGAQHERVLRVHDRAFGRAMRQLASGCAAYHWSSWSSPATSTAAERRPVRPGPPGLLPHRRERAGKAVEDHRVEAADVDAELERVRGRDAEEPPARQVALELAPLLGQVAGRGTPRRGRPRAGRVGFEAAPRVLRDELGAAAAAREREGLVAGARRSGPGARRSRRWPTRGRPSARRAAAVASTRARFSARGEPSSSICFDRQTAQRATPARRGCRSSRSRSRTSGPRRSARRGAAAGAARARRGYRRCRAACAARRSTTYRSRMRNVAHCLCDGRMPMCSISGLVSTTFAFLRAHARSSRVGVAVVGDGAQARHEPRSQRRAADPGRVPWWGRSAARCRGARDTTESTIGSW